MTVPFFFLAFDSFPPLLAGLLFKPCDSSFKGAHVVARGRSIFLHHLDAPGNKSQGLRKEERGIHLFRLVVSRFGQLFHPTVT